MADPVRLGELTLRRIAVSSMNNNVYLLTHCGTGAQVVIDAADHAPAIHRLLADGASDVRAPTTARLALIFTTHSHADHVRALAQVKADTGALTGCGSADAAAIPVPMEVMVEHGDVGNFPGFDLTAVALRGHTPGSIALVLEVPGEPVQIFSGDSLFPGGVGKTVSPAAFSSLYADVVARLFEVYPDDAVVWPGHGLPTTLGAERPHLAEWRARGW